MTIDGDENIKKAMKTCEAPLPSPVKVKFDPLFKFYPIVLAFLEKEGEILLVVFWIRTRATSRVFPVKVQTVKVKPERWPMYLTNLDINQVYLSSM